MTPADVVRDFPLLTRRWRDMGKLYPPRNARALERVPEGECFVASFVDRTPLAEPHVFIDGGKRYDWRLAVNRRVVIAVRPGIDARSAIADLFELTELYPMLIDFESKVFAAIVEKPGGGFKLWPYRKGSEPWQAVFG